MTSTDAPDWERVVTTVQATGDVPDAPDWERIVVGSGGTPVGGGGGQAGPVASDFGWVGWAYPPFSGTSTATVALASSFPFLSPVKALSSATVTHISYCVHGTGSSMQADKNFVGLYSYAATTGTTGTFTLLGSSAAGVIDNQFSAAGVWSEPLSAGVAVTAGTVYYCAIVAATSSGNIPTLMSNISFNGAAVYNTTGPPTNDVGYQYDTSSLTLPSTISWNRATANTGSTCWMAMY